MNLLDFVSFRLDVLGLHEFDSVRKRMSVVIRFPDGSVKVLVKGADTSMFIAITKDTESSVNLWRETQSHLTGYSIQGLRTLVVAARDLTVEELERWQCRYENASTSLTDRALKLRQTASLIESNLNILGATGIEDRLQDGVPETIESLRQAGIKVWVLTGDKQETAISIGLSCKLLTIDMQQIVINGNSEDECKNLLADAKAKYGIKSYIMGKQSNYMEDPYDTKSFKMQQSGSMKDEVKENAPLALVIDGNSLVYILEKDLESDVRCPTNIFSSFILPSSGFLSNFCVHIC